MIDKESKEFDFDDNGTYSDSLFEDEMKDLRVEKLNQRVTIITILIPCLIGVILFIAYRNLTGRVTESETLGSKELETLSKSLEDKFNTLSSQDKEIQTAISEKIAALEKNADSFRSSLEALEKNLGTTAKAIKNLADEKLDKKDQVDVTKTINDALVPIRNDMDSIGQIRKEIKSVSSEIDTLDQNLRQQLIPITAALSKLSSGADQTTDNISELSSKLSTLSDAKMSKEDVELELLKVRKIYQRIVEEEISKIDQRLDILLKRVKQLEKGLNQLSASSAADPPGTPPKTSAKRKSGAIVEQDIKE
jgi:chromosome segregation ATPase